MQRIAIIGSGHAGSTIPLIREYVLKGFTVDYYILSLGLVHDIEATDIYFTTQQKGIVRIPVDNWSSLYDYFGRNDSVNIFTINTPRPFEKVFILRQIAGLYRSLIIKNICKSINDKQYLFVNIVGRYDVYDIIRYCTYLKSKIVVSLHEVCNHLDPDFIHPNKVLSYLFKNKVPIVVFSKKSYEDILSYSSADSQFITHINFGLFTSYNIFRTHHKMPLPERYLLFIGRITPYKGLKIILDAFGNLSPSMKKKVKIVIAGSGYDSSLEKMKGYDSFLIINRFLRNEEIVELIKNSDGVICPYISASQSGIPQTVYVFGKPLIASNLPGLNDIVKEGFNGLLFAVNDSLHLASIIESTWNNPNILHKLSHNITEFEHSFKNYAWTFISESYLNSFL